MINKYLFMALVLVALFLVSGALKIRVQVGDGLSVWRENPGSMKYEVIFEGRTYYCDHVESPAGFPEKLLLYRGEDHLLLPDKYAVEKINK